MKNKIYNEKNFNRGGIAVMRKSMPFMCAAAVLLSFAAVPSDNLWAEDKPNSGPQIGVCTQGTNGVLNCRPAPEQDPRPSGKNNVDVLNDKASVFVLIGSFPEAIRIYDKVMQS